MTLAMTNFAAGRHFDPEFSGTKITDMSPEVFIEQVNSLFETWRAGKGGSVVEIDRDAYAKAVAYWSKHATAA